MDKEKLINLTNKLYNLTIFFPKKEPLRYKTREAADEILDNIVSWEVIGRSNPVKFLAVDKSNKEEIIFETEKNLEILKSYFKIAKWQNWVSYFDLLKIEEEYDIIKRDFKEEIKEQIKKSAEGNDSKIKKTDRGMPPVIASIVSVGDQELDPRKRKILEFLKEKEKVQVWQVKEIFPQVSKRTLRRDFEQLLKIDIIERMGERNNTFYRLKG